MQNSSAGYKYIYWDDWDAEGNCNADIYMGHIEDNSSIKSSELFDARGMEDNEDMPGIYYCKSLDDLYVWLKEIFEWIDPFAVEILKITPLTPVQERVYDNGRVACVTKEATASVVLEAEMTTEIKDLFARYFD